MKIYLNNNTLNKIKNIKINNFIIGSFDSVHKGHIKLANNFKNKIAVLLIWNVPHKKQIIYNLDERIYDIKRTINPDHIFIFDLKKNNCSAIEFIDKYLNIIQPKQISVGSDFIFGNDQKNVDYLKNNLCKSIKLKIIKRSKNSFNSSKIKSLLSKGKIEKINNILINPYFINSKVIKGNQIATKLLGFPTANLRINKDKICLKFGIYITFTILDNKKYKSVTFIGKSKTFNHIYPRIETHLINYSGINFYNKKINVTFIRRIGNVKKYKNIEMLKNDIKKYIEITNQYFKENIL